MTRIPSAVTDQGFYFFAADETDLTTPETGLASFTVYRSRNGAAETAMTTPTITEIDATNMPGVYFLLCDEDMTIDAGDDEQEMAYRITHSGMHPVVKIIELYRAKITAGYTLGVESDGDLTKVNTLDGHTAQTGDSFARLGAPAGASVAADIADVEGKVDDLEGRLTATRAGYLDNLSGGAAALETTAQSILADTGTDGVVVAAASKTGYRLSSTGIQDIWDALTSALSTASSIGKLLVDNINATISSRASQTSVDDLPTNTELSTALGTADDATLAAIAALNNLSAAQVNAEVDTALADYDPPTKTEMDTAQAAIIDGILDGIRIRKNTEFVAFPFKMVDETDHVTAETGLTVTATRSIDGAAFAACANSAAEIASGWYKITLAAADLNGDVIILRFTATGADDREIVVFTQPTD